MKIKGLLDKKSIISQKEKRPQKGGVGPKILSSAGLIFTTIGLVSLNVKTFSGKM